MKQTHVITCGSASAELVLPGSGLYRGVRFDHAGIFRNIRFRDHTYSDRWLDGPEDPLRHDNVTGPAEEFSAIGYEEAPVGGPFLKIGVGILQKTEEKPYAFTASYPLVDGGERSCEADGSSVVFRHTIQAGKWAYDYVKRVSWEKEGVLVLEHRLTNTGDAVLDGTVYNHDFFTFDDARPGKGFRVDLPYHPSGEWRQWPDDLLVGELTPDGIRLNDDVTPGKKICITHLGSTDGKPLPYRFSLVQEEKKMGVDVASEAPVCRIQFWGNHRVACMEPFMPLRLNSGETRSWTVRFSFVKY